ncbi:MAG: ATP synthase subunit I [Acidimicrobiales bacterium]
MTIPASIENDDPEVMIARDMVKKAVVIGPILILAFGLIWGVHGALSTAYGLAIVVANFVLSAAMLSWAGRISPAFIMGAALFGYLIRLSLIFLAIWLVRTASWVELVPLGITIVATHLGLLFWEMKRVSLSLAYPGLKPTPASKESTSK